MTLLPRDWELVWSPAFQCLGSVHMWSHQRELQWQPKHPKWNHVYQTQHQWNLSSLRTDNSYWHSDRISTKWGLKNWHWPTHPACQTHLWCMTLMIELHVPRFILLEICAKMWFLTRPWISKACDNLQCKLRPSCFYLRLTWHHTGEVVKLK